MRTTPMGAGTAVRRHPDLPIFELRRDGERLLYSPGQIAPLDPASAPSRSEVAAMAWPAARVSRSWEELLKEPFEPECLTVYLSNRCPLKCVYCYSAGQPGRAGNSGDVASLDAVMGGARLVAENCARKGLPMQLVLHGGGEPTTHWELLVEVVENVRALARDHGLDIQSYIATSGVISRDKAAWLGDNIDRIGLSVDAPPELHDSQRPLGNGKSGFAAVDRTAQILAGRRAELGIRCTVTSQSVRRQSEIVTFLNGRWGVKHFVFEPAYRDDGAGWGFCGDADAAEFACHFLAAQRVGEVIGCEVETSGIRLGELHGRFCNVARQVLQVTPDGSAVSCFVCTGGESAGFGDHVIGRWNASAGEFTVDVQAVGKLRELALEVPDDCSRCPNIYHCARDCPDTCPTSEPGRKMGGFRCKVNRWLSESWLFGALEGGVAKVEESPPDEQEIESVIEVIGAVGGASALQMASLWSRARHRGLMPRRAPDPLWAVRGFDHKGADAWDPVCAEAASRPADLPLSIYIHVPFCTRKCGFCDCFSVVPGSASGDLAHRYMRAMVAEAEAWSAVDPTARRPVTTVHFGGGTPTLMPKGDLAEFIEVLTSCFSVHADTEWALESTTSEIDEATLDWLMERGLNRLHLGIQTLSDEARKTAGRLEDAATALWKTRAAVERGFVVSVDVIAGMPGQNLDAYMETLRRLDDAGVQGFSLYKLNLTPFNRAFARHHVHAPSQGSRAFAQFLGGESFLRERGYEKTHFAHFSKSEDKYLYYRHVLRGEDLVSLGCTADGSVGRVHFRHPELNGYRGGASGGVPVLEGCVRESEEDSAIAPLSVELTTGKVSRLTLERLGPEFLGMVGRWEGEGLVKAHHATAEWELTATGSWYLADLLAEGASLAVRAPVPRTPA